MKHPFFLLASALLLQCCMAGQTNAAATGEIAFAQLDDCSQNRFWGINPGAEFPGASGSITVDAQNSGLLFESSFTAQSLYVGAVYRGVFPAGMSALTLEVMPFTDAEVSLRTIDSANRTFQTARTRLEPHQPAELTLDLTQPFPEAWGGDAGEYALPKTPLKEIQLLVNRKENSTERLLLQAIRVAAPGVNDKPFQGSSVDFATPFVSVQGEWSDQNAPKLQLSVKTAANLPENSVLSVSFPMMQRDEVQRFPLTPGTQETFVYQAPLLLGGNACNTYDLTVSVEHNYRLAAQTTTELRGADAPDWKRVKTTAEVSDNSIFGCATHFAYSNEPVGDFKGWYEYEALLDKMSQAGLKWIRDDFSPEYREDGTAYLSEGNLQRLRAAKARGFHVIAIVPTFADRSVEKTIAGVDGMIQDGGDLIDIFEIGNEPNNFGNWIGTYGGQWNAREKDNSTSRWLLEHRKLSNAVAEHIKQVKPDAVVIGGGCVISSNHRYLTDGFSPAFDGVSDHPYNTMLVPNRIAFGSGFAQRDGVENGAGDEFYSFEGIVRAYEKTFHAIGRDDLGIYITEFGFPTYYYDVDGKREEAKYGFAAYTEEASACYIVRRYLDVLALPVVKVAIQYDFYDDYDSAVNNPESGFGLIRSDRSPKLSYFAVQRLITLLDGTQYDAELDQRVVLLEDHLHRSMRREKLVDWDENGTAVIEADNALEYHLFRNGDGVLQLAVYSALPVTGEFSNRTAKLQIKGAASSANRAVGTDLVSGKRFDVPAIATGDDLQLNISVGNSPVIVTLL